MVEPFKQTVFGQALINLSTSYMNLGFDTVQPMAKNAISFFLSRKDLLLHFASSVGGEMAWVSEFIGWLKQQIKNARRSNSPSLQLPHTAPQAGLTVIIPGRPKRALRGFETASKSILIENGRAHLRFADMIGPGWPDPA